MLKMKYNLFFYGIGFLSLMLVNIVANSIEKDKNYQFQTFNRCLEIQKTLNGDLNRCL
tara:strand:- start:191 stop:364 length:174 start_codon:yes stop_codon:yes gene_type:complete